MSVLFKKEIKLKDSGEFDADLAGVLTISEEEAERIARAVSLIRGGFCTSIAGDRFGTFEYDDSNWGGGRHWGPRIEISGNGEFFAVFSPYKDDNAELRSEWIRTKEVLPSV